MKLNAIPAVSQNSSEQLRALAIAEFAAAFPLANYAEFYSMRGNADSPRKADATMTAGANRSIATSYTAKDNDPDFGAVVLKIYGDLVQTDRAYERRGIDIGSQRAKDLANFARSLGRYFMNAFVNDTLSATSFSGIKEQTTALSRKVVFGGENGAALPNGNGNTERKAQDAFIELMTEYISSIAPTCILANAQTIARMESVGRSYLSTENVADIYGQNQRVISFMGIPLVNAGYAANGTGLILPNNETEGTSTSACTSLYMIRFGEEVDTTIATNSGLDVEDLGAVGTKFQTMVELDVDVAVLDKTSILRIGGIKLS